jgi:hypothetical protein
MRQLPPARPSRYPPDSPIKNDLFALTARLPFENVPIAARSRVGTQPGNQRERLKPPIDWVLKHSLFFA